MRDSLHRGTVGLLVMGLTGCTAPTGDDPFATGASGGVTTNNPDPGGSDGASEQTSAAGDGQSSSGADGDSDSGGSSIKLDVGAMGDVPGGCVGKDCDGCTYVDLLFVIDNSVSMGDYQAALGLAFPAFASTLVEALPAGTNVHVGVTSTEMDYSSSGSTSISGGTCSFVGDGGQPNDSFYITPDVTNTGRNGAQGRLYDPGGGQTYFEFETNADPGVIAELESWFSGAANIGTGGSNIEMSAAPAGWVADPTNDATNAGFIRDEGAVLVVFFMQDEPDQTPLMVGGQPAGEAMLDKLVAAKAGCGGIDCIIAGGFLNEQACSATGNLPLDDLLAGVGESPIVQPLPNAGNPQAAADEMNLVLSGTLTEVIAQTCDQIPPAG